jgi:FkbM family methyltransferase
MNLFQKLYNALFTPMGRQNVMLHLRRAELAFRFRLATEPAVVYCLPEFGDFVVFKNDKMTNSIFLERQYEALSTIILRSILRPGDIAVDGGANVGYFSTLFSRCVGPTGKVHAFEPGPHTVGLLQKTVASLCLGNVKLHPYAIGEVEGVVNFATRSDGYDQHQYVLRASKSADSQIETVSVRSVRLDDQAAAEAFSDGRCALIKCDVEGFELEAIRGAKDLLVQPNAPVWMLEISRHDAALTRLEELISQFRGYRLFIAPLEAREMAQLSPLPASLSDLPLLANLYCFPEAGRYAERIPNALRLQPPPIH